MKAGPPPPFFTPARNTHMQFTLQHTDGHARCGTLTLNHGTVETPVFMPVGTYGSVKAIDRKSVV